METAQVTIGKLTATLREQTGKGASRRLRTTGQIPCIVYGGGKDPISAQLNPLLLEKCLDPDKLRNTLIDLTIEGGASPISETVMLKDYQVDVLRHDMTHVDFIRVGLDEKLKIKIPLELEGDSEGIKLGGVLHQVFRKLEVECTPDLIPARITGDISELNIGDSLSISDLVVPEGVSVCLPDEQTCVLVMAPRKADEEEEAEGEGEEGEEGAEGAEGEGETAEGGDKPAEG